MGSTSDLLFGFSLVVVVALCGYCFNRFRDFRGIWLELVIPYIAVFLIFMSFGTIILEKLCKSSAQSNQEAIQKNQANYLLTCSDFQKTLLLAGWLAAVILLLPNLRRVRELAYLSGTRMLAPLSFASVAMTILTIVMIKWPGDQYLPALLYFGSGYAILKFIELWTKRTDLWEEERQAQIADTVRRLENHTIIFGYGELGKLTLLNILLAVRHERNELGRAKRLDENGEYWLCHGILIVDKESAVFPIQVGVTVGLPPLAIVEETMSHGLINERWVRFPKYRAKFKGRIREERYVIPALVGDEKDEAALLKAQVEKAGTVISTTRDVEADTALVNHIAEKKPAKEPKVILVCNRRRGADLLANKCTLHKLRRHEVFEFMSYAGEILADFCSLKGEWDDAERKVLVVGNFARDLLLYHFLNAWAIQAGYFDEAGNPPTIRNVLVLDGIADYSWRCVHDHDVDKWDSAVHRCFTSNTIKSLNKAWYVASFRNLRGTIGPERVLYTPVLHEPPERYLDIVLSTWKPHVVLIIDRRPAQVLMHLSYFARFREQLDDRKLLIVTDSPWLKHEVLAELFREHGIVFAVFDPYATCAVEVATMAKQQ
jgi:voltage-gated potassium channel Kch